MHGLKHRTQNFQRGRSNVELLARLDEYSAQVKHNLAEARVIAFETSPHRLLPKHAYKNALLATRRLVGTIFLTRKNISEEWQKAAVDKMEKLLRCSRDHAMAKSFEISIAQDVFVLLSHHLGLSTVPEESLDYPSRWRLGVGRAKDDGRSQSRSRKFTRRSAPVQFPSTRSSNLPGTSHGVDLAAKNTRSCMSLSQLDCSDPDDDAEYQT